MYDTVNSAFTDALKREGKVINAYSDNKPYNVIFRRNSDTNKLQNTTTIYYSADSNIHSGQLLKYKGKTYLSINQESSENEVYLKSDLRQTNATMNYIVGGTEFNVPAYAYDVQSPLLINGNVISVVGGNIELISENSTTTRTLKIDDKFSAIGGYWKINNLIYKDNVVHIYVERYVESQNYTVTITANDSYVIGDTVQFVATAKAEDELISNANIIWTSSNDKATVTPDGKVSFIADGNVTISAEWEEHNVTTDKIITVTKPAKYELVVNSLDTYRTNETPILTATATIDNVVDSTATITWSSNSDSIATIDSITGKVTFHATGDVVFTATWTEHSVTATKAISVTKARYSLTVSGGSVYTINETPTLEATPYLDSSPRLTGYTITWDSSDKSKATIQSTGKNTGQITFLDAGEVTFTATWVEENITSTKVITITVPERDYWCNISDTRYSPVVPYNDTDNIATIKVGTAEQPFVFHVYDTLNTEVYTMYDTISPVWSLSGLTTEQLAKIHFTYSGSYKNRVYITIDNDETLSGVTFKLIMSSGANITNPCAIPVKIISAT